MQNLRGLRRRILTPNISQTKLDVRGFHVKDEESRTLLETVGSSFLAGYGYAAEGPHISTVEARLETIPIRFRGFAYEGAAMGFAVRDGLRLGRPRHVPAMLDGRGDGHVYMAYIGVGWAMARLPRFRWGQLYAPDPLLRWLVLDGYGFHQAYFQTEKYVHRQHRHRTFPWPAAGPAEYGGRVIDQGIGRAMWFIGGTEADRVTEMIAGFPEDRRADLYAGAGLAATYAGGACEAELVRFWERAGDHRAAVAQGSAFAAGARVRAGLVVPHNELAVAVFCGMTPAEAAKVTDATVPRGQSDAVPAYERWRRAIAAEFQARS
ncbi:DUF1702 family protein [Salinispora cortesiana]|uniref:DUF1702 family protein n=1 Tax=Salinispora cortesiana TaxID=1305843 RepID=UPI0003F66430|nr:DUF1702 family protein [Salinispora cortesiana]